MVDKIRVEVRKAQVARNLSDEQTMQLFQQNFEHSLDQLIGAAAWSKCSLASAPARLLCLAALGGSVLPGRPWVDGPRGAQPRPRVLERAASKAAHLPAVDHAGAIRSSFNVTEKALLLTRTLT